MLQNNAALKNLLILNRRFFLKSAYLKLYTRTFRKYLPGGLNSIFLTNKTKAFDFDLNESSLKTVIIEKTVIKSKLTYSVVDLYSVLSCIFYISVSNYVLLYNQVKLNIIFRL